MPDEDSIPETEVSKEFINFFIDELKDIYWAEKHLAKMLPKMEKGATAAGLKDMLAVHLATTHLQEERLEQVFELLGTTRKAKKSEAMAGLVEEAQDVMEDTGKSTPLRGRRPCTSRAKAETL